MPSGHSPLFHFFIIRHLSTIDNYLKDYKAGKRTGYLILNKNTQSSNDELDQVVLSINDASKKLNELYQSLEKKVEERTKSLQDALNEVKKLSGLLPLCSHCKKVRDDNGYWNQIDAYIEEHSEVDISHSICPECAKKYYPDMDLYDD